MYFKTQREGEVSLGFLNPNNCDRGKEEEMKEEENEERGLTQQGSGPVRTAGPSSGVLGMNGCKPSRQGWEGIPGRSRAPRRHGERKQLVLRRAWTAPRLAAGSSSGCSLCSARSPPRSSRPLPPSHQQGSLAASPPPRPFSSAQSTSLLSP